ncbi:unnamed protein product [Sphacelaria rigidula]
MDSVRCSLCLWNKCCCGLWGSVLYGTTRLGGRSIGRTDYGIRTGTYFELCGRRYYAIKSSRCERTMPTTASRYDSATAEHEHRTRTHRLRRSEVPGRTPRTVPPRELP